jgi:type III restriction enzyme
MAAAAVAALVAGQQAIEAEALAAFEKTEAAAAAIAADPTLSPNPVAQQVPGYPMRAAVAAAAQTLRLPNFMVPTGSSLFGKYAPLAKGSLLAGFDLGLQSIDIDFQRQAEALRVIDLQEQADHSYTPIIRKADAQLREPLLAYFRTASPLRQRQDAARAISKFFGKKLDYLPAPAVQAYVERVLAPFDPEQLRAAYADPAHYANAVYDHLDHLTSVHAMKVFDQRIDTNGIDVVPDYTFPAQRVVGKVALPLLRSLYAKEEAGNGPEGDLMQLLADADNVTFWTRNPARPGEGFRLNGPLANHYPDFIVHTTKGNTLLLETKGDIYDNADSAYKRHLGAAWALAAGKQYKYFMLFDKKTVDKAYRLDTFGPVLAAL